MARFGVSPSIGQWSLQNLLYRPAAPLKGIPCGHGRLDELVNTPSRFKRAIEHLDDVLHRLIADLSVDGLITSLSLEKQELRNGGNAVFDGDFLVLIGVELADFDFAGKLIGNLVDRRRQHAARAAPHGPEIYQDGLVTLHHFFSQFAAVSSITLALAMRAAFLKSYSLIECPRKTIGRFPLAL